VNASAIGLARHRAVLEAKVLMGDGGGGFIESWESYAVVWASLQPERGSETLEAGRSEGRVLHRVTLRRRTDVSANHRLRIGSRVLAIRAVIDKGLHESWMTLICEEGALS
jgi:SPP1 family predicted phage head-tail adaptor